MMIFPVGVEHPLDVTIQRPHGADPQMHQRPASFRQLRVTVEINLAQWGMILCAAAQKLALY